MRAQVRRRHRQEEEESVFVSMTDMTISFLIILMILLAFFASRFSNEEVVPLERFEEVQEMVTSLQDTIALLSVRAAVTPEEVDDLREALASARSDLTRAEAAFEEEKARLEAALARAKADIAAAEDELARMRREARAQDRSLDQARATIDRLNDTIASLQAELARLRPLEALVDDLRAQIADLQQQIADLQRPDPLEQYLRQVAGSRRIALEELRDAIRTEFPDLEVVISSESDALRFQGEGLFTSGSTNLAADKRQIVERIAELLDGLLPCYTLGPRSAYRAECNPGYAVIEAVQIEGHTDDVGSDTYNMGLGSGRAASTYGAMTTHVPVLLAHANLDGEPVLSTAGYGENRPAVSNETPEGRATNRRIDLRFIMYSPSRSEEIAIIRQRLSDPDARVEPSP